MRRSIRTLLGATAAAGIVALGVPALATPAAASTAGGTAAKTEFRTWGPYFAANGKAKARGSVHVKWSPNRKTNLVRVRGHLTDLDFRTYSQGGECAYVRFQVHRPGDPGYRWRFGPRYRWCGADKAPRFFAFNRTHVDGVRVHVCQIGRFANSPTRCSLPRPVYFARP